MGLWSLRYVSAGNSADLRDAIRWVKKVARKSLQMDYRGERENVLRGRRERSGASFGDPDHRISSESSSFEFLLRFSYWWLMARIKSKAFLVDEEERENELIGRRTSLVDE
jgi:hypothetical protein